MARRICSGMCTLVEKKGPHLMCLEEAALCLDQGS